MALRHGCLGLGTPILTALINGLFGGHLRDGVIEQVYLSCALEAVRRLVV
jgi:hypothetical protein